MRDMKQALGLLIERATPNLSVDDLDALGGASELAAMQASNLATIMDACGALVANDSDGGWMQDRKEVSALMWHVSSVADSIVALIELSDRVDVLRTYRPQHQPATE